MNEERSFERLVADNVAGEIGGLPMPDDFYRDMRTYASRTRQRPEWLALIKEPPMRISSSLAVGSPTARVAAIMVATLLIALVVAGAGIAGSQLLAADGTIVVDQSGNGTVATITEAVAMASDGDTILVKPGTYDESVTITKDIMLTGDGPLGDIVIEATDGPAFLFDRTEATLSTMVIRGEPSRILIMAGAPVLEGLLFDEAGLFSELPDTAALVIDETSEAVIRDSSFVAGTIWALGGSSPTFEDNELIGSGMAIGGEGSAPIIRGNHFAESVCSGDIPIFWVHDGASPTLEDNVIETCSGMGVEVDSGASAVINSNTIRATGRGIVVQTNAEATIEDNELTDNNTGIDVLGKATLEGNAVANNVIGLDLSFGAAPALSGNSICDNETNIRLSVGVQMPDTSGDVICSETLGEASE